MSWKLPEIPKVTQPFYELWLEKVLEHHKRNSQRLAIASADDPSHKITWLDLYNKAHNLASFLDQHNFGHGQICCVVLPNCWQIAVSFFGAVLTGGAVTFSSILFTEYELATQMKDSEATVVITQSKYLEKVLAAVSHGTKVKTVICEAGESSASLPEGVFSFSHATAQTDVLFTPDKSKYSPSDLLFLPFSSGTTSAAKGVLLTHGNYSVSALMFNKIATELWYPKFIDDYDPEKEHQLAVRPMNHIYGLTFLLHAIYEGVTTVLTRKLDLHSFCRATQNYKIKQLYLIPANVLSLAKDPAVAEYDLSSVRFVLSGAENCTEEVVNLFLDRHPYVKFFTQGYGMSETGSAVSIPLLDVRKNLSAGIFSPLFEHKIIDTETGIPVEAGLMGEICIRGCMMKGYLNRPASEAFDEDGWYHTGDIGYLDDKEQLHIADRLKHVIKVGGIQVIPTELENLLLSHPKIKDAVVIGVKDDQHQERPKAFIIRNDDSVTEQEIQQFLSGKLAAYKQLTGGIEFTDHFPRTVSGKLLRRSLKPS